jgi:DNA-binding response OmpR family regulator
MGSPLRLLMVEDSERDTALLKLYLRRNGYDVELQRVDTQDALRSLLEERAWDIVVSDFNLPGFNAFDALNVVREGGRTTPFIVMSGEVDPQVVEGIVAAGSRYVTKFEMPAIVPIIDEYMRART